MAKMIFLFLVLPSIAFGQMFAPNQKLDEYKASNNKTYKIGDTIRLKSGSRPDGSFNYLIGGDVGAQNVTTNPGLNGAPANFSNRFGIIKKIKSYKVNSVQKVIFALHFEKLFINYTFDIEGAIFSCEIIDCIPSNKQVVAPAQSSVNTSSSSMINQSGNSHPRRFNDRNAPPSYITGKVIKLPDGSYGSVSNVNGSMITCKLYNLYDALDTNKQSINDVNDAIVAMGNPLESNIGMAHANYVGINTTDGNFCLVFIIDGPETVLSTDPPFNKMTIRAKYPFWDYFIKHKVGIKNNPKTDKHFNDNTLLKDVGNAIGTNMPNGSFINCTVRGINKKYRLNELYTQSDTSPRSLGLETVMLNFMRADETHKFGVGTGKYYGVNVADDNEWAYIIITHDKGLWQLTPQSKADMMAIFPFYNYWVLHNNIPPTYFPGVADPPDLPVSETWDPFLPVTTSYFGMLAYDFQSAERHYPYSASIVGTTNMQAEYLGYKPGVGSYFRATMGDMLYTYKGLEITKATSMLKVYSGDVLIFRPAINLQGMLYMYIVKDLGQIDSKLLGLKNSPAANLKDAQPPNFGFYKEKHHFAEPTTSYLSKPIDEGLYTYNDWKAMQITFKYVADTKTLIVMEKGVEKDYHGALYYPSKYAIANSESDTSASFRSAVLNFYQKEYQKKPGSATYIFTGKGAGDKAFMITFINGEPPKTSNGDIDVKYIHQLDPKNYFSSNETN